MAKVLAGVVVAALGAAFVSAQSADAPWPPPGVIVGGGPGITRPVVITRVQPPYTPAAQKQRIQGVVSVACVIELDGTVGPARVVQSLDKKVGLDEQALAAAKKWRFTTGTKDFVPARMLVTLNLVFSLPGEKPPSTWPALLTGDATSTIDTSQWREEVADAGKWRVRIRYPETWRPERVPQQLVHLDAQDSEEELFIEQPFTMPQPRVLPVSLRQLDQFAEEIRRRPETIERDMVGVGQGISAGRWWLWQELHATLSQFAHVGGNARSAEFLRRHEGGRFWHFTTIVGNDMVTMVVVRMIRSGHTPEGIDSDLRESGRIFDQILRRMTFETR